MKQIILLGLLSFLQCFNLYSQKKVDLQIEASPNYSYRTFLSDPDLNITTEDEPKFGYTISVKSGIWIADNVQVSSGLKYSNKGYKTKIGYQDDSNNLNSTIGSLDFHFIEIPLYCKYKFSMGDFHLSPTVGVSYGRLIKLEARYNDTLKSANKEEIEESGFSRNMINLLCGLELSYFINDVFGFKLEPNMDYSKTDLFEHKDSVISSYLYSLGINIGVIIRL